MITAVAKNKNPPGRSGGFFMRSGPVSVFPLQEPEEEKHQEDTDSGDAEK
jgi:hypothetical protein